MVSCPTFGFTYRTNEVVNDPVPKTAEFPLITRPVNILVKRFIFIHSVPKIITEQTDGAIGHSAIVTGIRFMNR